MSYDMGGDYTLEPLVYGVHNRGFRLVEIIEYPLDKYVVKYRSHGTGLVYMYPGSRGQFMGPQEVQKDSHTLRTLNTIQLTNYVYICLFYRLCQNQEQSYQKRIKILP